MRRDKYASLFPQILPLVQPCPRHLATEALRYAGVDFFERTNLWKQRFVNDITPGHNELALPSESELAQVELLQVGGVRLVLGMDYELASPSSLNVRIPCSARGTDSLLWVSLKPSRLASGVPEELMAQSGDALVYGALAKIKSLSGNSVAWTDPSGAELNLKLYLR